MREINTADQIFEKWEAVINHEDLPEISDPYKKKVTAVLLENEEQALRTQALNEGPTNVVTDGTGQMKKWDPVLISMLRRAMPNIIAYDVAGVQPMTGPTGLIFAMKSTYRSAAAGQSDGDEALFNEANTGYSGAQMADNGTVADAGSSIGNNTKATVTGDPGDVDATNYGIGQGTTTTKAEFWGYIDQQFAEMGFTIDKVEVGVRSRGLKATYSVELAQDMKAIHGLDADSELSNILSTEILAEINREVIRATYWTAKAGAADTAVAGTFNLDVDSNGRWSVERFKGLMFQIEKEANKIAVETRRGKGNFIICSANVASALVMTNLLDTGGRTSVAPGSVDPVGDLFVGTLNGRTKVFIDPFLQSDIVLVGYKGSNAYDAGLFYCPYVPLTIYRTVGEEDFQPRIGFKTRYGMVSNPFTGAGNGTITKAANQYYRLFRVSNLG